MQFMGLRSKKFKIAHFSKDKIREFAKILLKKEGLYIVGVGTFYIKQVKERIGTNPRTGEPITIKAHKRIKYRPSKVIKRFINE